MADDGCDTRRKRRAYGWRLADTFPIAKTHGYADGNAFRTAGRQPVPLAVAFRHAKQHAHSESYADAQSESRAVCEPE